MKPLFVFIVLLSMLSCSNEYHEVLYYETGEVGYEEFSTDIDSIKRFFVYYKNGRICNEGSWLYNPGSEREYEATGICKDYYPDGFPKNEYRCVHGRSLIPCVDSMDKYELVVDLAPLDSIVEKVEEGDTVLYLPFRVFVKGVVGVSYKVVMYGNDELMYNPVKTERKQVEYKLVGADGKESHQTIDETMYPYMIQFNNFFFKKTETETEITFTAKFAVYFPAIPDSMAKRPHKIGECSVRYQKPNR